MTSSEEIAELKVIKYRVLSKTIDFARYFNKKLSGKKYIVGKHHDRISEALDRVYNGECKRLIINIAPRYGKTQLAVKYFIAKGLAMNPASRYIHLSYSDDLALDNSEAVRDLVKSESYQQLFNVKIKPNSDAKNKWYTTAGGGVYATSTKGQVTGFGAGQVDPEQDELFDFIENSQFVSAREKYFNDLFGGALVIDDPLKPEDADSDTIRERINNRYDSTIKNRVNSRNTPIVIIMQRLHEQDLCGYLIDRDASEWEVLSLPCINEDGTALWPHKHTVEELAKMEKDNDVVYGRQYMQNPMPQKGLLFPPKELRYFIPSDTLTKSFESSIGYADIADEGADYLSAPIGRNIKSDIYVVDTTFSKGNTDITIPMVSAMLIKNGANYCRVESNSMGAMYARNLQKELKICRVIPALSTTNKHTRILMDAAFIKKYCLFVHPNHQTDEYKAFMKQLSSYLKETIVKHDDAADSMSGLVIFIRAMLGHYYQ